MAADTDSDYLAGRALAQRGAIQNEWKALIGGEKPKAAPAPAAAEGAARAAPEPATDGAAPENGAGTIPVLPDYWDQLSPGARLVVAPSLAGPQEFLHGAGVVAKDVGKGLIDAPRQLAGGALDFVNNAWNFADRIVKRAEDAGLPNAYFRIFDESGKFDPRIESEDEFRKAQAAGQEHIFQVPTTGAPDTVTGNLIRTLVPFALGRGSAGGLPAQLPGVAGDLARDFVSGAVGQDPDQPRLSNIIDRVAPNFVAGFLKAKPEDEDSLLGNLKTGLEYAGLGGLMSGTIRALKTLKESGAAVPEVGDLGEGGATAPASAAAASPAGAPAAGGQAAERDILSLGDPLAPAVQIRPQPYHEGMAEVTLGRLNAADEPSALGPAAGPREPAVTEGALPHEPVPVEPQRLASWLVGKGGLQDQGGEVSHVAGDTRARPGLISGNGMTLDDAARAAWEEGFLPGAERPTSDALIDALADDLRDNPQYRASDASAAGEHHAALARNRELDAIGDEFGIPTRNITRDDFFNALAERQGQGEEAAAGPTPTFSFEQQPGLYGGTPSTRSGMYDIKDADGRAVAFAQIDFKPDGKTANIDLIASPAEGTLGRIIGPAQMRSMARAFFEQHPDIDQIVGERVTGARYGSAAEGQSVTFSRDQVMPGRVAAGTPPEPVMMSPEQISDYLAGRRVDNPVKLNLGRIGSPEDIADALAQVSKTIPKQGVQSNDATVALSDALGLTPEQFLAGYRGEGLNASETTALRFMLDSSASQLVDYAKAARNPLANAEERAQFVKAFTVHRALQDYAENARADAGRTLQSWAIMSRQRSNYARAIGDLVNRVDANGDIGSMADRIAELDNPLQLNRFVAQSMQGSGRDLLLKGWYNALLSSPTTVVKKLTSDIGMATWNTAATAVAERFGSGAVPAGESFELLAGYAGSLKDALRAGGKALLAGESQFMREYSTLDWARAPSTSPGEAAARVTRNFRLSALMNGAPEVLDTAAPTAAFYEHLRALLPTSWIAGADDFAKVWNYRAELRRLAWRQAGGDADKFARLLDDTPYPLSQQAVGAALKNTFQEPLTGIGASLRDIFDAIKISIPLGDSRFEIPIGRMVVPFVKVPYNIAKTAADNSPLALMLRRNQEVLQGGPSAERDLMMARVGLGTAVTLGLADLALNNYITGQGPSDPSLRREWIDAGHRPYSVEIPGKRPVSYNWAEPFGLTASAVADTFNILKFREDEADFGTLIPSLVFGVGNAMLSKTYYEGVASFFNALQHPESEGDRWLQAMGASAIPQLVNRLGDAQDDWRRAHYDFMDALEARMPFLREGLPPQRTLWGDPVPAREGYMPLLPGRGLAQIVSPATLGPDPGKAEPIDRWMWDNRDAFGLGGRGEPRGIQKLSRTQSYSAPNNRAVSAQVELSPQQYDRLQALAGNELKDPATGLGAGDALNGLVLGHYPSAATQHEWDKASPEERAMIVRSLVAKYRGAARQQLRVEFPDLDQALQSAWQAKAATLVGAQ